MKKITIRGWAMDVPCGKDVVHVCFVLPDTFFEVELFTCHACGAIISVDRERERYSGVAWSDIQTRESCPQCGNSLREAAKYPGTFVCPGGGKGHFVPPATYPPDSALVSFEAWDPYV